MFGLHIWLLALDGGGSGKSLPLAAIGAYALAWTVGFLFFIAPGGIGAREVALAITLAPALPAGAPQVVAIISRVVFTLVDLIGSGLAFLIGGRVRFSALRARPADMPPGDVVAADAPDQGVSSSSR
jgi:glycosyltransferase 2 family protein